MYIDWRIWEHMDRLDGNLLPNTMHFDIMRKLIPTKILSGCRSHDALVEIFEELLD